jgi:hypothetical protein
VHVGEIVRHFHRVQALGVRPTLGFPVLAVPGVKVLDRMGAFSGDSLYFFLYVSASLRLAMSPRQEASARSFPLSEISLVTSGLQERIARGYSTSSTQPNQFIYE